MWEHSSLPYVFLSSFGVSGSELTIEPINRCGMSKSSRFGPFLTTTTAGGGVGEGSRL